MKKDLFRELYKQVYELVLKDCPLTSQSDFLHGYLSVYSMVQVYPWLEDEFGGPWEIHERIREIARIRRELLQDNDIPVDVRAGYVVDLMDTYLLYSDMSFLDVALDSAYEIFTPRKQDKMTLPCRTPNICRLLCNCYYFTGEEESGLLARSLVTEAFGLSKKMSCEELVAWWDAIRFYESVIGEMEVSVEERNRLIGERTRLGVSVEQIEDERIERFFRKGNNNDVCLLANIFDILARREFAAYNEFYGKKG